ncbi:MAG: T9SS type A sorting domain-containing protein [Saprospiraceae bacterium]|nr:T9SS type A sorting domain-containing protein [Saprospiraceae bacterium]
MDVKLLKKMDVQLRVLNLNGQLVFESSQMNVADIHQEIDLNNQAPGMYILQVIADGKPYHAKLMVAR